MRILIQALVILLLLANTFLTYSQIKNQKDSLNIDKTLKNTNFLSVLFKLEEASPEASLMIVDNKIYRAGSDDFNKIPKSKLKLISLFKDTASSSGVHYVYIFKIIN